MNIIASCLKALMLAVTAASAFELVDIPPEEVMVPQGGEISLSCASDEPFTVCQWYLENSDKKCTVSMDGIGSVSACAADSRINWEVDETTCGISITDEVGSDDEDQYSCSLTLVDGESVQVQATVAVKVARPATVSFGENWEEVDVYHATAEEAFIVECHALGGYPEPEMNAVLGEEEDVIDAENDLVLEVMTEGERVENEDGSVDVVKYFTYVPHMNDCGKYVKCEALQKDANGDIIYTSGEAVQSRKIMVQYEPQSMGDFNGEISYTIGDEFVDVVIPFSANPVPADSDATWHISERGALPLEIVAGDMNGAKYEAMSLDSTGHNVEAMLRIYGLEEDDKYTTFSFHVQNGLGEKTFEFSLVNYEMVNKEGSEDYGSYEEGKGGVKQPEVQTESIGPGAIVAIVIVVLAVVISIALTIYTKKEKKFCFAEVAERGTVEQTSKEEASPQEKAGLVPQDSKDSEEKK